MIPAARTLGNKGVRYTGCMNTIVFATSNSGKISTLRRTLDKAGLADVTIDARALDVIEPQADTCEEVALSKARQAYQLVQRPVLVDDSSFHITALGGFPGVYAKYMNDTLGAEGIVSFMSGKDDRSAYFAGVLVFIDEHGAEHIFHDAPYHGVITSEVHDISDKTPWSVLHKIFMPNGSDKVLGNMTADDFHRTERAAPSKYSQFVDWLAKSNQ